MHWLGIGVEAFTESVNDRVPRNAFHGLFQKSDHKEVYLRLSKEDQRASVRCPDADKTTTQEVENGGPAEAEAAEVADHHHLPEGHTSRS